MDTSPGNEGFSSINVTPLVDVMLVLLIVFMVTAPMLASSVDVELARADTGRTEAPPAEPPLVVTVTEDGRVWVGDVPTTDPEASIRTLMAGARSRAIAVRADGRCRYQDVTSTIAAARRAGVQAVELVFDPVAEAP